MSSPRKSKVSVETELQALRDKCRSSLWAFAQVVEPHRVYGECHRELFDWWQQQELEGVENTMALMPRDHQKSHCVAVWVCWQIYLNPAVTVLYVCATEDLAIKQLYDIKNLLTSEEFTRLCPDLIAPRENDRDKWSETAIAVDHPIRKQERPRDPTVQAIGLTSNIIGAHCNIMVKDDVVIDKNSETATARMKVTSKCGHLSSVLTTDGKEWVVGTRYHPSDHYQDLIDMEEDEFDDEDELIGTRKVYSVHERQVETSGVFLWPRQAREGDGKMFGFDNRQLARKKAKYLSDMRNYFCQYYNNPNAINTGGISRSQFLYYNQELLKQKGTNWYYKGAKLNLVAAVDFAYSLTAKGDQTCIMVLGMDEDKNIYVLDIDRFQTKQPSVYWSHLEDLYIKWGFKHVRAEVVAAQDVIVSALRSYVTDERYPIRIHEYRPTGASGSKEERISQALEPLYDAGKVFHYRGGVCSMLEEELIVDKPAHDDIKDTLMIGVTFDKLKPPAKQRVHDDFAMYEQLGGHSRFGGRS